MIASLATLQNWKKEKKNKKKQNRQTNKTCTVAMNFFVTNFHCFAIF